MRSFSDPFNKDVIIVEFQAPLKFKNCLPKVLTIQLLREKLEAALTLSIKPGELYEELYFSV